MMDWMHTALTAINSQPTPNLQFFAAWAFAMLLAIGVTLVAVPALLLGIWIRWRFWPGKRTYTGSTGLR